MKVIYMFGPFLVMLAGSLVGAIGGYRGYEINFDNGFQIVGLIIVAFGLGWCVLKYAPMFWAALSSLWK